MTSKTTIALAAIGLALVALAPLANAAVTDDTVSRAFPYISGVRAETAPDTGVGWYDSNNPPNVCVITLLGVQTPIGGSFYYETARVYVNLGGTGSPVTTPGVGPVAVPCPAVINPLCNVGCGIAVAPITVSPVARTLIPQDGLICTQQSAFVTCIATAGAWTLAKCPAASATFTARVDPNKGLLGGTGLANALLSQDINCNVAYSNKVTATSKLGSDGNPLASGFEGVTATDVVPLAGGDGYAVQCLSATYTTIDSSVVPPAIGSATEDGVDYELFLDLGSPGANWATDLVHHVSGAGGANLALQGLYDLGGGNNCDF